MACMGCHQATSTSSTVPNGGSVTVTPAAPLTRRARRSGTAATRSVPATRNGSGSQPPVVRTTFGVTPSRSSAAVTSAACGSRVAACGSAARSCAVRRHVPSALARSRGLAGSATYTTRSRTSSSGSPSGQNPSGPIRTSYAEHVLPGLQERGGDRPRFEPHPGGQLMHPPEHPAQREDGLRRDRDGEPAPAGGRIELGGQAERPLDLPERLPRRRAAGRVAIGVSRYSRPDLTSSSSPKCWRSRARAPLIVGWLSRRRSPALVTLRCSSSAPSTARRLTSMPAALVTKSLSAANGRQIGTYTYLLTISFVQMITI